jgi:hypothetical protein
VEENTEEKEYDELEKSIQDKTICAVEESICHILDQGIATDNIEHLYKLVDIHKDMYNEKYWKVKESEIMRYDAYGNYNRYDDYNRRGMDGRYRGHDYMNRMHDGYNRYEEGREQYNRGNYGAKDDTLRSLEYMLESAMDFFKMLKSEANSQEEMQLIREYAKKISDM